eukprot:COSAG01_NODE_23982_length_794_cov_2801.660432_2_plen_90_part_01
MSTLIWAKPIQSRRCDQTLDPLVTLAVVDVGPKVQLARWARVYLSHIEFPSMILFISWIGVIAHWIAVEVVFMDDAVEDWVSSSHIAFPT